MCQCVCLCACVRVCACVCERDYCKLLCVGKYTIKEFYAHAGRHACTHALTHTHTHNERERACVCVCEREREPVCVSVCVCVCRAVILEPFFPSFSLIDPTTRKSKLNPW